MTMRIDVKEDNTQKLKKILERLKKDKIKVGIFGEDDSFELMVATVNEFGTDIKPRHSRYLTVPCNRKTAGKKARSFKDLYTLKDSHGQLWLVRNKGKTNIEFMYMLAKHVKIPERSFFRSSLEENKEKIQRRIKNKLRQVFNFKITLDEFYTNIGEYVVGLIKRKIRELKTPPKSPITLASSPRKTNPLINSGRLINSIVWKLERG